MPTERFEIRCGSVHSIAAFLGFNLKTKDSSNEAFTRTGCARAEHAYLSFPDLSYYKNGVEVVKLPHGASGGRLQPTSAGRDARLQLSVGGANELKPAEAQCRLVFPIPRTGTNYGADPLGPQPAPWPACRRLQAPESPRKERDEGVLAQRAPRPGGPPHRLCRTRLREN